MTDATGAVFQVTLTPEKAETAEAEPSNYFMQLEVLEKPKAPQKPAEDASIDDKSNYEIALSRFETSKPNLANTQKKLVGRYFKFSKASLSSVLKNRDELITKKEKPVTTTSPVIRVPSEGSGNGSSTPAPPAAPSSGDPASSLLRPPSEPTSE